MKVRPSHFRFHGLQSTQIRKLSDVSQAYIKICSEPLEWTNLFDVFLLKFS